MKNDPVENALGQLDDYQPGTLEGRKVFSQALAGKSNLLMAKAARRIGDVQCADYTDALAAALERCLDKGSGFDKGCAASLAIARALVSFDYDGADLFLRGMKHVQREPVWGGSVDTAPDLRAACAIGLANSLHPHKLRHLLELLVDPEWIARAGAVRAIAAVGSESASLLLRYKALIGDPEADVISDCLIGLLEIGGADALPLAQSLAISGDRQVAEAAILALGASRRADAIEFLIKRFDEVANQEMKGCILVSLSSSRTGIAIDFLLHVLRTASRATSEAAREALSIHRNDVRIQEALEEAVSGQERPSSHESRYRTS